MIGGNIKDTVQVILLVILEVSKRIIMTREETITELRDHINRIGEKVITQKNQTTLDMMDSQRINSIRIRTSTVIETIENTNKKTIENIEIVETIIIIDTRRVFETTKTGSINNIPISIEERANTTAIIATTGTLEMIDLIKREEIISNPKRLTIKAKGIRTTNTKILKVGGKNKPPNKRSINDIGKSINKIKTCFLRLLKLKSKNRWGRTKSKRFQSKFWRKAKKKAKNR